MRTLADEVMRARRRQKSPANGDSTVDVDDNLAPEQDEPDATRSGPTENGRTHRKTAWLHSSAATLFLATCVMVSMREIYYTPPQVPVDADVATFSELRALKHVEVLAGVTATLA